MKEFSDSGQISCLHGNEYPSALKDDIFLDLLSHSQLVKNDFVYRSCL